MEYKNKKVLVLGFGKSGKSASKLLKNRNFTIYVSCDGGKNNQGVKQDVEAMGYNYLSIAESENIILSKGVDLIVLSPSFSIFSRIPCLAKLNGIEVITELELASKLFKGKSIYITGTNGKTTSATLLGEIITRGGYECKVVGNIGLPFCDYAEKMSKDSIAVVEASSFQLEGMSSYAPDIGIILNIGVDHIDRHKTQAEYIRCKHKIFQNMGENSTLIINKLDVNTRQTLAYRKNCFDTLYFSSSSLASGAYVYDGEIFYGVSAEYIMDVSNIKLLGDHNLQNILACITASKILGIENTVISEVVSSFCGVEHRLQYVQTIDGVKYYNDSKSTNISSAISGLNSFKEDVIAIVGGSDKGYEYDELFNNLPQNVKKIIAFGQTKSKINNSAKRCCYKNITLAEWLKESVLLAKYMAKEGDVIVLSPASASFDMFNDYEDRGRQFIRIVKELEGNSHNEKN